MLEENVERIAKSSEAIEKNTALLVQLAKKLLPAESIDAKENTQGVERVVTIAEKDGEKCVRVHAGKYDFIVALHDLGTGMNWHEAKKAAEEQGLRLFTKEEGMLMYIFKDEINAALVELGGDELSEDDYYWSSSEYFTTSAWYLYFYSGPVGNNTKSNALNVARGVAAF